jgi:hypothetical protein
MPNLTPDYNSGKLSYVYKKESVTNLKEKGNQNAFLHFWTGCYEYNMFVDFLKLSEVVDMDGSFPTTAPCSIWIYG